MSTDIDRSLTAASPPVADAHRIDGLAAGLGLLDAIEIVLRQRFESVLHYLSLAADPADGDVESIHKVRVASRRLAAALGVLSQGLPGAPRKRAVRRLEKLRRRCGKARDLDVRLAFLDSLLANVPIESAGIIERICEKTAFLRAKEQRKLARKLSAFVHPLEEARAQLIESAASVRNDAPQYPTFREVGARTLRGGLASLWRSAEADLESPRALHALRCAGKSLRYAFEVFMPVLHDSFREEFYPQLEHIQDLLGRIHDATVAGKALRRQRKKALGAICRNRSRSRKTWSAFTRREIKDGFDVIFDAYEQQAEHSRREFFDIWPSFSGKSFRIPVGELLDEVLVGPKCSLEAARQETTETRSRTASLPKPCDRIDEWPDSEAGLTAPALVPDAKGGGR